MSAESTFGEIESVKATAELNCGVTGKVVEKTTENGENLVKLETNVLNQDGESTCPGHAILVLPSR